MASASLRFQAKAEGEARWARKVGARDGRAKEGGPKNPDPKAPTAALTVDGGGRLDVARVVGGDLPGAGETWGEGVGFHGRGHEVAMPRGRENEREQG